MWRQLKVGCQSCLVGRWSWTKGGRIKKWGKKPIFPSGLTPDRSFSPPTPSACSHLGREHELWVGLSWKFPWFLFRGWVRLKRWREEKKAQGQEQGCLFWKRGSKTFATRLSEHSAPEHSNLQQRAGRTGDDATGMAECLRDHLFAKLACRPGVPLMNLAELRPKAASLKFSLHGHLEDVCSMWTCSIYAYIYLLFSCDCNPLHF